MRRDTTSAKVIVMLPKLAAVPRSQLVTPFAGMPARGAWYRIGS